MKSRLVASCLCLAGALCALAASLTAAPYQVENLNRGVVAVRTSSTQVYVGWRLLGLDPSGIAFNVYRSANGGTAVRLNASPITNSTNLVDGSANLGQSNTYTIRPVINGVEQAAGDTGFTLPANAATQQFLRVGLQSPGGTYSPGDCSVGDVDGDGQYEIFLKWDPSNQRDNSQTGVTSVVFIDCYRLNGTRLWRVNLGRNIRAGAHYTQFQVYDYDGDGRAEMAVKTGDATISGTGQVIGNANANHVNSGGHILVGPEFLTVFNGLTGAAMSTVAYQPLRGSISDWGDSNGNRSERYLAGTAWLDGQRPSIIMGRGYYERSKVAAWDFRNGALTLRWAFDSGSGNFGGRGTHWFSVADVDNNGSGQEIIYGGMTLNSNGTGRYTTSFYAHGDALHVGDFITGRAGQEIWQIHESGNIGATLRDGINGAIIFSKANNTGGEGPARGVGDDVYAGSAGGEFWASGVAFSNTSGGNIGRTPGSQNFLAYWDADFTRELLDSNHVDKYGTGSDTRLLTATGASSINGSKATPNLSADLFGDWREEIILAEGGSAIRIYTTTIVASNRIHTLMHDPQYRAQVACQNSAYNQPPHLSFLPSVSIPSTPRNDIVYVGGTAPNNNPPSVSITSPTNGATFTAGANITINANASDTDGTVTGVEFFQGGTSLGTDTSSPYSVTWNNVPAGTYSLTARATDDDGAQTTSSPPISITVGPGGGGADTYQAESAVLAGGTVSESTNGGFLGSGYANSSLNGGTITFNNVDGNGGGTKSLAIRFALGVAAARTGNLTVNGSTTSITFQPTGAWTTWQTLNVNITLNNNTSNTITFTTTGGDLANIDQITVP